MTHAKDAADPAGPAPRLRLGFAGTPAFAAHILERLLAAGRVPVVVYTQPDRPAGRGREPTPSPVKALALAHGLTVRQPASLRPAAEATALAAWQLDVLVVAAYGLILPPAVLGAPRYGCVNVHASLLPRWRGAAPVERAIMAGDQETGVSLMRMERGLDTGPVYLERRVPIEPDTDGPTLEARLADAGADALLECLDDLPDLIPTPQPDQGVTYASKLTPDDREIDWSQPAEAIARRVRALTGRLPAVARIDDVRVTLLQAGAEPGPDGGSPGTVVSADAGGIRIQCGRGLLNLQRLRLSVGKGRPLRAADAVNGYAHLFRPGTRLLPAAAS